MLQNSTNQQKSDPREEGKFIINENHIYYNNYIAIVLSVLRFTDSDYPFGIFKLFLNVNWAVYYIYIDDEGNLNKQRSTKNAHTTTDRVTRTPLRTGGELVWSGKVSSSCSTSDNGQSTTKNMLNLHG
jgi:hypothetical protein